MALENEYKSKNDFIPKDSIKEEPQEKISQKKEKKIPVIKNPLKDFTGRFDKKKIPATFLKLQLLNALESLGHGLEDETGRTKKVSKKVKDSLKDKLKEELLRVSLPSIRLIEILWNLECNEIWLFSTSASVTEEFEKIFFEAFGLTLVQITAGTLNVDFDRLQLGIKLNLQPLIDLEPVSLFHEKITLPEKIMNSNDMSPPF